MGIRTCAHLTLAIALSLITAAPTRGQTVLDARPAAEPEDRSGFPWACFGLSVMALGGLYVLVRRRERAAEADPRLRRGPDIGWYCRACDKDVSGSECPHCRAPNPFVHEPIVANAGSRSGRHRRPEPPGTRRGD